MSDIFDLKIKIDLCFFSVRVYIKIIFVMYETVEIINLYVYMYV